MPGDRRPIDPSQAMAPPGWASRLWHNRWLVLVGASWVETCTGLNVMYATFSPAIKSSLSYNQQQISRLGVAKDFGNAAEIIAGCLSQVLSSRGLLFLGSAQFFLGYGILWLLVVQKLPCTPPFWMVFVLIFIGANAQKYLDMAAVVSTLPSFPDSRGSLLGVLKAFKGLSGAIFSHVYSAFFAPLRSAALLIVAFGPSIVAIVTSPFVRPVGTTYVEDRKTENRMYMLLYGICFLIAGYMVFLLFFQTNVPSGGSYRSIMPFLGLLVLILSPLAPALISALWLSRDVDAPSIESGLSKTLLLQGSSNDDVETLEEGHHDYPGADQATTATEIGGDLSVSQSLQTIELWLLFFALYCGLGSGSTALDNLGQMAQAQGYEDTHTFVSIFSISSYMGHLVGGHSSEMLVRKGIARPASLIVVEGIMMVAQFLFAMAWRGSMYFATICLGLSYGSFSSINPAISSELFGFGSFGPIFGFLTLSAPASSTVLAGFVAGTVYDREAEKQHSSECKGQRCFHLTCLIMVAVCALGMILSAVLSWRTRDVYRRRLESSRNVKSNGL